MIYTLALIIIKVKNKTNDKKDKIYNKSIYSRNADFYTKTQSQPKETKNMFNLCSKPHRNLINLDDIGILYGQFKQNQQ